MKMKQNVCVIAVCLLLAIFTTMHARESVPPMKFGYSSSSDAAPYTMFLLHAGFLAGGRENTCYFVRSRLDIQQRVSLDATMYRHFNGDFLYGANVGFGPIIQLTVGVEFGDRSFYINKDSTIEHVKFRNLSTGEYAPYSLFPDFRMPQTTTSYNLGVNFAVRFKGKNYWRGVGECNRAINLRWEMMYAPSIVYQHTLDITTQGPYQAETATYELDGVKVRKFGFRMIMDSRLGSKIGWILEFGIRPGIRSELNEEGTFANGYVRMGVAIGLSIGGAKNLHKVKFAEEIPET